ncbi:nucleolar DEAD-box protein required for synthesis of 60S ribosomal subunit [Geranomyces variabilis]|uniref:RNA helicase n=1 Tax=Geranomyces variabilis TaxID=109894 RepID=A0AAD5TNE0_9FUNG|nr:nucleolar DEAD-box protein required for synthesis of 60S ribosomal subunit [Geranomyces variabilis]
MISKKGGPAAKAKAQPVAAKAAVTAPTAAKVLGNKVSPPAPDRPAFDPLLISTLEDEDDVPQFGQPDDEDEDDEENEETAAGGTFSGSSLGKRRDAAQDAQDDADAEAAEAADVLHQKRKAEYFAAAPAVEDPTAMDSFNGMRLSRPILKGIAAMGFVKPTAIPSRTIPIAMQGTDICAFAVTGSGKTGAFIIPVLERLLLRPTNVATTRVLVLVPTRELADRMLEDGFTAELNEIIKHTPKSRQTMLVSATMTADLIKLSLNRPVRLFVDSSSSIASRLIQEFIRVRSHREEQRPAILAALCTRTYKVQTIIFFCS